MKEKANKIKKVKSRRKRKRLYKERLKYISLSYYINKLMKNRKIPIVNSSNINIAKLAINQIKS